MTKIVKIRQRTPVTEVFGSQIISSDNSLYDTFKCKLNNFNVNSVIKLINKKHTDIFFFVIISGGETIQSTQD